MDVTNRATAQGYTFPHGWTVQATTEPDTDARPTDCDCYDSSDITAWHSGEWDFVYLVVRVVDADGREWGRELLGACEQGHVPGAPGWSDPLDEDAGYLPEVIDDACLAAINEVDTFCASWPTPASA